MMQLNELAKALKDAKVDTKLSGEIMLLATPPARYGAVLVSLAESDAVYPGRGNDGGKSTKVVEFSLDLPHVGLKLSGTMYARYRTTPDGYEISAEASLPRGVKPMDADDKTAVLAHVEHVIVKSPVFNAAMDAAEARLLGTKRKPTTASAGPQLERPRLVRTAKPADTAAATT